MQLGYFDIAQPTKIYRLPKRDTRSPLFSLRSTGYVQSFFQQIRGLGCIGIVTIEGNRVTRRAIRGL
jgi:hypothetical protein